MKLIDNKFYGYLEIFANYFLLNILWVLACLPIITFFPATSAMYSVIRCWKLKDDTGVFVLFIKYFKENFKQSFSIGIIWFVITIILYVDFLFMRQSEFSSFLFIPLLIIGLLFAFTSIYVFPIISHYNISTKTIIKSSFFISMTYFPMTILNLILLALIAAALYYYPITSLILFSFAAFVNFSICHIVFTKNSKLHEQSALQQTTE
ncbi:MULTISPECIES: YesL family protein [Gracilibacillus]|uniref:YesL family protein n=1 Tax=Gracilibacillus TaxID=74385 RepID=UPI000825D792|nr:MULTISPECIES: YesL family protein [Gracilibacillus]